jgi:hypothetical protein
VQARSEGCEQVALPLGLAPAGGRTEATCADKEDSTQQQRRACII